MTALRPSPQTAAADNSRTERRQQRRNWRRRLFVVLAANHGLAILASLGLLCGLAVGVMMLGFEWLIAELQVWLLEFGVHTDTAALPEDFESLPPLWRLLLPTCGALLIGIVFTFLKPTTRFTGPAHVLDSLAKNDGRLPPQNLFAQFGGALVALGTGMSVGREGPSVHMGAALASLLGQRLILPASSLRILVACGVAAAISASFNTPLAGVVFAMEVILMSYNIAGFAPVILAAVSAAAIMQSVHGSEPLFEVAVFQLVSLNELPYLAVVGVGIGVMAAMFIRSIDFFGRLWRNGPPWARMGIAGLLTGGLALAVPEIMGVGYDTLNMALLGQVSIATALFLMAAKLVASTAAVGLGVPGGLIGPTLVIGAMAGIVFGEVATLIGIDNPSPLAFYALLGMTAMMGATLQAPLAALTAMLELTANHHIILPGMLTLMTGYLTNRVFFKHQPLFLRVLHLRGNLWQPDPQIIALQQANIANRVNTSATLLSATLSPLQLQAACADYHWLVFPQAGKVFRSSEVLTWLNTAPSLPAALTATDLIVPALRTAEVDATASFYRARDVFKQTDAQILTVTWPNGDLLGVLLQDALLGEHSV